MPSQFECYQVPRTHGKDSLQNRHLLRVVSFLIEVAEPGGAEEGVGAGLVTFALFAEPGDWNE